MSGYQNSLKIVNSKSNLRIFRTIFLFLMVSILLMLGFSTVSSSSQVVPTISIHSVVRDESVVVVGKNFPVNQTFTVRMGAMGTAGIGGVAVGSFSTGSSTSFQQTFQIPDSLKGSRQIAIRMDSNLGYYSFNWFYNNSTAVTTSNTSSSTTPATTVSSYTGIPTFAISEVKVGESVTIRTSNFPPNQTFTVTMGPMYTRGIGGTVITTFNSEDGGAFEKSFDIPDSLKESRMISIRTQTSHANPYFSYNWFYNVPAETSTTDDDDDEEEDDDSAGGTGGGTTPVVYTGIPTFKVCSVQKDSSVTIATTNWPANQTFTVTMGHFGAAGIGGTVAGTIDSGDGGALNVTLNIPANLKGLYRIAIRAQTAHAYPFYAYNWFYNNTASVC